MLAIKNQSLSVDFLKELIEKWKAENSVNLKPFTLHQYELILKLLSVKDIVFRTSKQAVHHAN